MNPAVDTSDEGPFDFDLVVPTIGRPALRRLLESLADAMPGSDGPRPTSVVVVDDRPGTPEPLQLLPRFPIAIEVVRTGGRGPAASRNRGWRRTTAPWACFLDDDVVVRPGWFDRLGDDLRRAGAGVGAVQGRVHVPLPAHRPPTDRERNVAGLAEARWITADMAVRRAALDDVGGFDERFPRAYREDSDLALRLLDADWGLTVGTREIDHPVGPAPWTASITSQRGNADDALMRRLHGPDWRHRAAAPRGTLRRHVATTVTLAATGAALAARHPRAAAVLAGAWTAQWGRSTWQRAAPGPRTRAELGAMAVTSAALPVAATRHAAAGRLRARRLVPHGAADRWGTRRPTAVLFDRDGTLVEDVPYNGDPNLVRPVPGARQALDRLRAEGVRVGLVSNQSGVARGMLTPDQVDAVHARLAALVGPFDVVQWCPHGPADGCGCRKPAPGMVEAAARQMGVPTWACALVGDIGTDVEAGLAAGARAVLVPTEVTRAREVAAAPEVAGSLGDAVDALLGGRRLPAGHRAARQGAATDVEERAS